MDVVSGRRVQGWNEEDTARRLSHVAMTVSEWRDWRAVGRRSAEQGVRGGSCTEYAGGRHPDLREWIESRILRDAVLACTSLRPHLSSSVHGSTLIIVKLDAGGSTDGRVRVMLDNYIESCNRSWS